MNQWAWCRMVLIAGLLAAISSAGCRAISDALATDKTRFLSPEKVIEAPSRSTVHPILPSVGVLDTHRRRVPNSTLPTEADLVYSDKDYVIGPLDLLEIRVLDLFAEGMETPLQRQVSESGYIHLPLLQDRPRGSRIQAAGLTKDELRRVIGKAYEEAQVLKEPEISVTLITRRHAIFSITGAVARPGTYTVTRPDMRLMETLAMAGGITQLKIPYLYVIRQPRAIRAGGEPQKETVPAEQVPPELPSLPPEPGEEEGDGEEEDDDVERGIEELREELFGGGQELPAPAQVLALSENGAGGAPAVGGAGEPADEQDAEADGPKPRTVPRFIWDPSTGTFRRVHQEELPAETPGDDGVGRVRPGRGVAAGPAEGEPPAAPAKDPFGWSQIGEKGGARIIAINREKLHQNPRLNIVIRENDTVYVPPLEGGEFYVQGEVLRPGVYSLLGREVTVKQALAAAGNMGPLAWPKNSVLVRRVGPDQEQHIPLDVQAIVRGEEPDLYLRPDDVLAIGTDIRAQFYIVLRNAFRMTWGFGFIWDRNFADPYDIGPDIGYNSKRFTRW